MSEELDLEFVDLSEKGKREGKTISSDRRLFMQLLAFGGCRDTAPIIEALKQKELTAVLYEDLNDPQGIGLLIHSEDPDYFLTEARTFLNQAPFDQLTPKPEYTMFGRTYSIGYEDDLDRVLVERPRERINNPDIPWAIWYPLRRSGKFVHLSAQEQRAILMEHGGIGRAYGRAGLGTDIRLACHGLDKNDNDFLVALLGANLFPLSAIVERMRRTKQTSLYLENLGPFFIGKAVWQGK